MPIDCAFYGTVFRAESKVSKNGKPYLRLTVRVGDGDAAQWISVMAFDQEAIAAADRFARDARVYVEGSISVNEWTDRDGNKKTGLNVMAWHCRLPAIGRNRPKREKEDDPVSTRSATARGREFYSDPLPF